MPSAKCDNELSDWGSRRTRRTGGLCHAAPKSSQRSLKTEHTLSGLYRAKKSTFRNRKFVTPYSEYFDITPFISKTTPKSPRPTP